jgi:hypothetical protein
LGVFLPAIGAVDGIHSDIFKVTHSDLLLRIGGARTRVAHFDE